MSVSKNDPLFAALTMLDRLEELREELLEHGLSTLDELDARIAELEAEVGDEADDDSGGDGPV